MNSDCFVIARRGRSKSVLLKTRDRFAARSKAARLLALTQVSLALLLLTTPVFAKEPPPQFPAVQKPAAHFFTGEKLTYKISYLGMTVGEAEAEITGLETLRGRPVYHIVVRVKSHPVIDLLYKVRDEHHTWIDAEKLHSLRYEKKLQEGRYRAHEVMTYDQEAHTALYQSLSNQSEKEMLISKDVQDQLSCGYFFRTLEVQPETTVTLPVNADEKNWDLEIRLLKAAPLEIEGVGRFQALEAEPLIKFQGIFVKRGKIRGWISLDERRIPLMMKVKVPVLGSVTARLSAYKPGTKPEVPRT